MTGESHAIGRLLGAVAGDAHGGSTRRRQDDIGENLRDDGARAARLTPFRPRPIIPAMRRKSPWAGAILGLLLGVALAEPALADECGCGGPKSYYAKKYGTVKPPAFTAVTGTTAPVPTPAPDPAAAPAGTAMTAPVNPPATGSGG